MNNEEYLKEFGRRVFERRTELKMSQDELAHKIGYKTRTSICHIENGRRNCEQSIIAKLARALEVPPSYLMGWSDITGDIYIEDHFKTDFESRLDECSTEELLHYLQIITELLKQKNSAK